MTTTEIIVVFYQIRIYIVLLLLYDNSINSFLAPKLYLGVDTKYSFHNTIMEREKSYDIILIRNFRALPYVEQVSRQNTNNLEVSMKTKVYQIVKEFVPSTLGWISLAVAVYIDGSFILEFTLIAVARVLP